MTENDLNHSEIEYGKQHIHGHYNPVHVQDTVGTIILGVITLVLLIALLRSQARNRKLIFHLSKQIMNMDENGKT